MPQNGTFLGKVKWKATKQKQQSDQGSVQTPTALYSARVQYDPQEMERNGATAKHVAWPSCAWLLLHFFPFFLWAILRPHPVYKLKQDSDLRTCCRPHLSRSQALLDLSRDCSSATSPANCQRSARDLPDCFRLTFRLWHRN